MKLFISLGASLIALTIATPSSAAPVIINANVNLFNSPFSFDLQGVTFTLSSVDSFSAPLLVSNGPDGAFSSIFGSPSSSFVDRGVVQYGPGLFGSYTAFLSPTPVQFSNGGNFLGIRATVGPDEYYGFVYTTGNVLRSYGFETAANTVITATTAVPEPTTWAMMFVGFGMLAGSMRYRRRSARLAYA